MIKVIEEDLVNHGLMEALKMHEIQKCKLGQQVTQIMAVEDDFGGAEVFYEKTLETTGTLNFLVVVVLGIIWIKAHGNCIDLATGEEIEGICAGMAVSKYVAFISVVGTLNSLASSWGGTQYAYGLIQIALANLKALLAIEQMTFEHDQQPDITKGLLCTNVWFAYPTHPDRLIFRSLNLTIAPNTMNALLGGSGEGKSTLLKLCTRQYNPVQGSISIGGMELSHINRPRVVSICDQECLLFDASVFENVAYLVPAEAQAQAALLGKSAEAFIEESIWKALELTGIKPAFDKKPDKLDFQIGLRGKNLSGGMRQSIAIARTLVHSAEFVLFDEPTSGMDPTKTTSTMKNLFELSADSKSGTGLTLTTCLRLNSALFITHDYEALPWMDRINCLHNFSVAEAGTHNELLELNGVYKRMYDGAQGMGSGSNVQMSPEKLVQLWPFASTTDTQRQNIAQMFVRRTIPDGGLLFKPGEMVDSMFVVARGSITLTNPKMKYQPGDSLCEDCMLEEAVSVSTAEADGETVLLSLQKQSFEMAMDRAPDVRLAIEEICQPRSLVMDCACVTDVHVLHVLHVYMFACTGTSASSGRLAS